MSVKVRLRDINVTKLNSRTVTLLTLFLNKVRGRSDCDLQMHQTGIVKKILKYAEVSNDPELIVLSMRIKKSIVTHFKEMRSQDQLLIY